MPIAYSFSFLSFAFLSFSSCNFSKFFFLSFYLDCLISVNTVSCRSSASFLMSSLICSRSFSVFSSLLFRSSNNFVLYSNSLQVKIQSDLPSKAKPKRSSLHQFCQCQQVHRHKDFVGRLWQFVALKRSQIMFPPPSMKTMKLNLIAVPIPFLAPSFSSSFKFITSFYQSLDTNSHLFIKYV